MKKLTYEEMKQKCYYIKCETQEQFGKVLDWIQLCHPDDLGIQKRKLWERFKNDATVGVTKKDVVSFGCGLRHPFILYFEDIEFVEPKVEDKISLTVEQLKRFYLEAYKEGETAKLVCGKMSSKSLNSLEDKDWMTTLVKALNK